MKWRYLFDSLRRINSSKSCPYCGSADTKRTDSKFYVTSLMECQECSFQFRFPYDDHSKNFQFYQSQYTQKGLTTDLPGDEELDHLLETDFKDTVKDFSQQILLISQIQPKSRLKILDYGANWGYTSYQFQKAGFDVTSFEISQRMAQFGRKLGISIHQDFSDVVGKYDVIFSSHVIEHLPDVRQFIERCQQNLTGEGVFICYCPNGSAELRSTDFKKFHSLWGEVHPNFLSAGFFRKVFSNNPYIITGTPFDLGHLADWTGSQKLMGLESGELLVIAKPNYQLT